MSSFISSFLSKSSSSTPTSSTPKAFIPSDSCRPAVRARVWYPGNPTELTNRLSEWFDAARKRSPFRTARDGGTSAGSTYGTTECRRQVKIRALIMPHAGYRYCGHISAQSVSDIDWTDIERVFIIGPDHRGATYKSGPKSARALLTRYSQWKTPLGMVPIDTETISTLLESQTKKKSPLFALMSAEDDCDEHCIEMTVPMLYYSWIHHSNQLNKDEDFKKISDVTMAEPSPPPSTTTAVTQKSVNSMPKIIPIVLGSCSNRKDQLQYASVLAPYVADESNLFVISSDFCHYGSRFRYDPFNQGIIKTQSQSQSSLSSSSMIETWKMIEEMDQNGAALISKMDTQGFGDYLDETKNTICGRNAIMILLQSFDIIKEQQKKLAQRLAKMGGSRSPSSMKGGSFSPSSEYRFITPIERGTTQDVRGRVLGYDQSSKVMNPSDSSVSYCSIVFYTEE